MGTTPSVASRPVMTMRSPIAVADIKRKILRAHRRTPFGGNPGREEKAVGMSPYIAPRPPRAGVKGKLRLGEAVEMGMKRMEVAFETGAFRPAVETDARFVGCVAFRHPFRLRKPERVEKRFKLRRRAFANTDNSDIRRFDHSDSILRPMLRDEAGGHPACGAAS